MALKSQLRTYTINKGKMDEFVKGWRDGIVPIRLQYGWRVDGGWIYADENKFVWILSLEGDEDWDAKSQVYYNAPERKALTPDPSQLIAHMDVHFINTVL